MGTGGGGAVTFGGQQQLCSTVHVLNAPESFTLKRSSLYYRSHLNNNNKKKNLGANEDLVKLSKCPLTLQGLVLVI